MSTYDTFTTVGHQGPLLYTVPDASKMLNLSRSKLYELLASGEIQSCQIGRCRRIPRAALDEYVASLTSREAESD